MHHISMESSSRLKISKEIIALKNILAQMDMINVQRLFYPKSAEYICTSSTHRIDYILGHKTNLNKFLKTKIL